MEEGTEGGEGKDQRGRRRLRWFLEKEKKKKKVEGSNIFSVSLFFFF
jgi:hypothetical protein